MSHVHPELRLRARELRKNQTPAEQKLWAWLCKRQADGFKFRRQHPIGAYILDFYCPRARLAVEVDGAIHANQVAYDAERSAYLEARGLKVIRFTNDDVVHNLGAVFERIIEVCRQQISAEAAKR